MAAAYTIGLVEIGDERAYRDYVREAMPTLARRPFEVICDDAEPQMLEGDGGVRVVVMRWPSRKDALAWYCSDQYQAAAAKRREAAETTMVLANGS